MTKLKLKENVGSAEPVNSDYDFEGIETGDMFHCYDSDITILIVGDGEGQYGIIDLTTGEYIPEEDEEYVQDVFDRIISQYGDFYPVSKATLKFTVGE